MWNDVKRKRFNDLRNLDRPLTLSEQEELDGMVRELEADEAAYLQPATERLNRENEQAARRNEELRKLAERKQALVVKLQKVLADTRVEQQAIAKELAVLTSASPSGV